MGSVQILWDPLRGGRLGLLQRDQKIAGRTLRGHEKITEDYIHMGDKKIAQTESAQNVPLPPKYSRKFNSPSSYLDSFRGLKDTVVGDEKL